MGPELREGTGAIRLLQYGLAYAVLVAGCGPAAESADGTDPSGDMVAAVRPGIDVLLSDSIHLIAGRRVGLITNQTGLTGAGGSSIDALNGAPETDLVALFSPEHGIRGAAEAGEVVDSGVDAATGLPVHSLYGDTRKPTPAMLAGVDVLLFDIQDIGARYYTYLSTLALAMEAAGEAGIPFVVLDRPNPIGGVSMNGNVLDTAFASFVGPYPVPMRHGLTAGEWAKLVRGEFGVEADLYVVPLDGWTRSMWFDATGLPWVAPSPNMPDLESATHYPGTCLFEGTSLSVGRGTDRAFQHIGAPWLDAVAVVDSLNAMALAGVRFEAVEFTAVSPGDGKHAGVVSHGIRFIVTDRTAYDPVHAALATLIAIRDMHDEFAFIPAGFDRLAGTDRLRLDIEAGARADALAAGWRDHLQAFAALRDPHLIYPLDRQ
jgi:uncharacterized protein YbbC (DUF1343 family)